MNSGKEIINKQTMVARYFFVLAFAMIFSLIGQTACFAASVILQWDPVVDAELAGYKVYYQADSSVQPFTGTGAMQGGSPVSVQDQTSATIDGLDPAYSYYFAVTAYNTSGLESVYSNVVYVPEMMVPTVAISSPNNNATVNGTIFVSADASDNVGVTKVEFYLNGDIQATDAASPYVYSWDTSTLISGTYTLMAKSYDAAGNVGQSSNVSITVVNDRTAPAISLTTPGNGDTVSGTVTVAYSASDDIGVSRVEFYENNTLLSATNVAPYSYNWDTTSVANGGYTLIAKAYDNAGNMGQSSNISVTVFNDTTAPTITAFTIPSTASSTTVVISSFTATDDARVTGYMITESSSAPAAGASGWTALAPSSFTFSAEGDKTAYAWARDVAGNVSAYRSATVTITLPDITAPVVNTFVMPSTSASLTVAISSLSASDAFGVTGYMITESSSAPAAGASGWTALASSSFTFSAEGDKTAYAWARDAAGNVSAYRSATVTITLPDITAPVVNTFVMPSTSASLTVAISSLSASDAFGVTGYMITESSSAPTADASGWTALAPSSFTFPAEGNKTAYAWARDAAGNVSAYRSRTVVIILPDTTTPTVTITSPISGNTVSGTVSVIATANDNIGVSKVEFYVNNVLQATTTATPYSFSWNTTAVSNGSYILYVKAYDAAGNVGQSASITVAVNNSSTSSLVKIRGDVNGDMKVDITDVYLALNIATGKILPTADQLARGDVAPIVNGVSRPDGKIDMSDVIAILNKVIGKSSI